MPIDYSKYPINWKTEIRPAILQRENNCCKFCQVPNGTIVCRGEWHGAPVWQNDDGQIFSATNGEYITSAYVGDVFTKQSQKVTKIVLTVAHIDHNLENNDYENLAALCQRCHLHLDRDQHKESRNKKKNQTKLF